MNYCKSVWTCITRFIDSYYYVKRDVSLAKNEEKIIQEFNF